MAGEGWMGARLTALAVSRGEDMNSLPVISDEDNSSETLNIMSSFPHFNPSRPQHRRPKIEI